MKTSEIGKTAATLYERMDKDGYSKSVVDTAKWVIGHFEKYCRSNDIKTADIRAVTWFLHDKYDIQLQESKGWMQTILRRPLLMLLEFNEGGNYCKSHLIGSTTKVPPEHSKLFMSCRTLVNGMDIGISSKNRKLKFMADYILYLDKHGITEPKDMTASHAHSYLASRTDYAPSTLSIVALTIREMYDWMYREKMIECTGSDVFPRIIQATRRDILSYYSHDEIKQILDRIDTSTKKGKGDYFIVSAMAFLGLRVSDLMNLKLSDIDWVGNHIRMIQQKTGKELVLPLVDDVKFPMLDYLKHARNDSCDQEHVLIKFHAPYTKYTYSSSLYQVVARCITQAEIEIGNRHRGPHALRHSLATNLMNNNVPLSAISSILGHVSTKTTEVYLSIDEKGLSELSLEVDDVL